MPGYFEQFLFEHVIGEQLLVFPAMDADGGLLREQLAQDCLVLPHAIVISSVVVDGHQVVCVPILQHVEEHFGGVAINFRVHYASQFRSQFFGVGFHEPLIVERGDADDFFHLGGFQAGVGRSIWHRFRS